MDKLLEVLIKAVEAVLRALRFPESVINQSKAVLSVLLLIVVFTSVLYTCFKWLLEKHKKKMLDTDLAPYFSYTDVVNARKYYVNTNHQSVAPSIDDELGGKYISAPKQEIIPFFLNKVFTYKNERSRFFLILADSGMGKTTFMINLYVAYRKKFRWSANTEFDIRLLPLGAKDVIEKVKEIKEKEKTILLLDAFDEDIAALKNYNNRWREILNAIGSFRTVVISCRTQFFPSDIDEPHQTGYFNHGKGEEMAFEKSYLSVFDEKDIKAYLYKRYSWLQYNKRKKALAIVEQCPNLMVRPMLLSHINDFVNSEEEIKTTTQLYKLLIQKWIERESKKPGIRENYGSEEKYQELLLEFSQKLARYLYNNRDKGGYSISKDKKFESVGISLNTLENENNELGEKAGRSKSLLNRDAVGNYKFSHKSVLEYLLAAEIMNDGQLGLGFSFIGMDMTRLFYNNMIDEYLNTVEAKTTLVPYHKKDLIFIENQQTDILKLSALKTPILYNTYKFYYLLHALNYIVLFEPDTIKRIERNPNQVNNIRHFCEKGKRLEVMHFQAQLKEDALSHISLHNYKSRKFTNVESSNYEKILREAHAKNNTFKKVLSEILTYFNNPNTLEIPKSLVDLDILMNKINLLQKAGIKVSILQRALQHLTPIKATDVETKTWRQPNPEDKIKYWRGDMRTM